MTHLDRHRVRHRDRCPTPHATTCGCTSPGTPPTRTAAHGADHRARGRRVHLGRRRAGATSTGSPGSSPCRSGTAAPSSPRLRPSRSSELAFFPLWSYAHPKAIELAERLATYTPGDLNRVFFTTGGGEAVETAWKLAKQYFKLTGKPMKHKVISRYVAYHGTPQGALSITGIPDAKKYFEPLRPGRAQGAQHELLPRARARRRRRGVRPLGRGPDRRGDRVRGPRHRRRRLPRAGAELRRLLPAAARLLRAGARDLRPGTTC